VFPIFEPKHRLIYKLPFNPDRIIQHALMNIVEPIWDNLLIHDTYACRQGMGVHSGSTRTMDFIRKVGREGYCLKMDISKFYPSLKHDILFDIVKKKIKCKDTLWLLEDIIYSVEGGYNVPIGNYTSQWFGNLRYCDDFLLFHEDKRFLNDMKDYIESYLKETLDLTLSKADVFPIS
jgi:RNA-directed DNA polymerase